MLILLQNDQSLLDIPEEDRSSHPQAGVLGASLEAGENMYQDLQSTYHELSRASEYLEPNVVQI